MQNQGFRQQPKGFATKAIHAGQSPEQWSTRCVVTPIVTSVTFALEKPDELGQYFYGRTANPTRAVLQNCLAALDDATFALTYASGLGAATATLSLLKPGDHIISSYDIFGGTNRLIRAQSEHYGFETDFVDADDLLNGLRKLIKPNTRMIHIESPSNPFMKIIDIQEVAKIAKSYKNLEILLVVDNTFLTAYFQRPLELGADIVMYSLTKFFNGHSDVVMGALITNCPKLHEKLKFTQTYGGVIPSPFDCSQVLRSLKTLELRMDRQQTSSLAIAKFLEGHKFIERVLHPGLPSHPQHKIALKQSYGHSGMLSFYIKGTLENTKQFITSLKLISSAASLGGTETLVSMPTCVSHMSVPKDIKIKIGITDNLVRMSVGLEDVNDLINDLDEALKASQ